MKIQFFIFPILLFVFASFTPFSKPKVFPSFSKQTIDGKLIDNSFFERKKTIVILAHLGCPAAMQLIDDLYTSDTSKFQILLFLENTPFQVNLFNSDDKNMWSDLRNYFKLKPILNNLIAECETENLKKDGNDIIIGEQCKKISKKLKANGSPYIYHVNQQGEIVKMMDYYYGEKDKVQRVNKMMKILQID
jgi:thioredoxin-related protein